MVIPNPENKSKNAIKIPADSEISPRAIGRFFLTGWSRSFLASTRSLITYDEDDKKQKAIKAKKLGIKSW